MEEEEEVLCPFCEETAHVFPCFLGTGAILFPPVPEKLPEAKGNLVNFSQARQSNEISEIYITKMYICPGCGYTMFFSDYPLKKPNWDE